MIGNSPDEHQPDAEIQARAKTPELARTVSKKFTKLVRKTFAEHGRLGHKKTAPTNNLPSSGIESLNFNLPTESDHVTEQNIPAAKKEKTPQEYSDYAYKMLTRIHLFLYPSLTSRVMDEVRTWLTKQTLKLFAEAEKGRFENVLAKQAVNFEHLVNYYWHHVVHRYNLNDDQFNMGSEIDPESVDLTKEPGGYCLIGELDQEAKNFLASSDQGVFLSALCLRMLRSEVIFRNRYRENREDWIPNRTVKALYKEEEIRQSNRELTLLVYKGHQVKKVFLPIDLVQDDYGRLDQDQMRLWIQILNQQISSSEGWHKHQINKTEINQSYNSQLSFADSREMRADPTNFHAADLSLVIDYGDNADGGISLEKLQNDSRNYIGLGTPLSLRVGVDSTGNITSIGAKFNHQYIDGAQANEELYGAVTDTLRRFFESELSAQPILEKRTGFQLAKLKKRITNIFYDKEPKIERVVETRISLSETNSGGQSINTRINAIYADKKNVANKVKKNLVESTGLDMSPDLSFEVIKAAALQKAELTKPLLKNERLLLINRLENAYKIATEVKPDKKMLLQLAYLMTFGHQHGHTLTINPTTHLLNPVILPFPSRIQEQIVKLGADEPIPVNLIEDIYSIFNLMKSSQELVPVMGVTARGIKKLLQFLGQMIEGKKGQPVTNTTMMSTLVKPDSYKTVYQQGNEEHHHYSLKSFSTAFNEIYPDMVMAACDIDEGQAVNVSVRYRGNNPHVLANFEERFHQNFELLLTFFEKMMAGVQQQIDQAISQDSYNYSP
jgi:hypothetical protein